MTAGHRAGEPSPTEGEARAWGWVAYLRDGGTTPWRDWTAPGADAGRILPGAQQLELLRRLNLAGSPGPRLAARVLEASAPGRGRPDLELSGAAPPPRFGPRPVDPADLPDRELLRVAGMILAEDVVAEGLPPRPEPGWHRPWRTKYRLVGDPELTAPLRDRLVARGRPPGGRGSSILVVGSSLDRMLVDAWTARAFDTGAPAWGAWLGSVRQRDQLPPRIDLLSTARVWAARVGPERVHVVLDRAALPGLLGLRRSLRPPVAVPAEGADLARRVAAALGLLVPAPQRRELLHRTLRPQLERAGGTVLVVPSRHRDWVAARAARLAAELQRDGYALHGEPALLMPGDPAGVEAPTGAGTLALALRMMLAAMEEAP